MADSIAQQRIILGIECPWVLGTETTHVWHSKFSLSNSPTMSAADAETTAFDLWLPIKGMTTADAKFVSWSYYPAGSKVSAAGGTYPPTLHPGDASGVSPGSQRQVQQAEVCMVIRAQCSTNVRGKPVYLRKWVHNIFSDPADCNKAPPRLNEATLLAPWQTGAGPHKVVPVDPTGGNPGALWKVEDHLFTHQFRRGTRRKAKASSGLLGSLEKDIQDALQAKGLLSVLEDVAGAA